MKPLLIVFLFISLCIFLIHDVEAQVDNAETKEYYISGKIIDADTRLPIEGAEISIIDKGNVRTYQNRTNTRGDFEVVTTIKPSKHILIEVSKKGYIFKEKRHTISSDIESLIIPLESVIVISGYALNRKNGKAIQNAKVYYFIGSKRIDVEKTNEEGFFTFPVDQRPGSTIHIYIDAISYKLAIKEYNIPKRVRLINILLSKKPKIGTEWLILGGGAASGLTSLGFHLSSNKQYDDYNDFTNPERETAYTKADNRNKVAVSTFYAGSAAIAVGISYVLFFKDKKESFNGLGNQWQPKMDYDLVTQNYQFGFTYQF